MKNKILLFTDIHWGRKNNAESHNIDCENFINFLCDHVTDEISSIIFLGDWFENRPAINTLTLQYSIKSAKKLNELGIPIYFITGNHDLYYRNNRNVFSTEVFGELSNFKIINTITEISDKILIVPYLFEHEYADLLKYSNDYIFGHFEFKGFVVTGEHRTLEHGPDHSTFQNFKRIFSGHFHKRQEKDNVCYIGNTFPMDFSDANDIDRGLCIFDTSNGKYEFINWQDGPSYVKCQLTDLIGGEVNPKPNAIVECIADIEINYLESQTLKAKLIKKHKLRNLKMIDIFDAEPNIDETDDVSENLNTHEMVVSLLKKVSVSNIDNNKLIKIYSGISK